MTQIRSDRLTWARLPVMDATLFVAAAVLRAAGRAAWRITALAAVVVSAPVIGLMPGQAVVGLVIDGLILVPVAVSWPRTRKVPS